MNTRMPFGKHRGEPLSSIPPGYLRWLLENVGDLSRDLRRDIEAELDGPNVRNPPTTRTVVLRVPTDEVRRVVRDWHRGAIQKWHPDRTGGDTRVAAAVNDLADQLETALAAVDRRKDAS